MIAQAADPWRFTPHPEVWVMVLGVLALAVYAAKVIAPQAVGPGAAAFTRKHKVSFAFAVVLLWFSSDWPLHDIGEQYLYSAHMLQHLLMSFVVPPLFLWATPEWFARLFLGSDRPGRVARAVRKLARPAPAGIIFNLVIILLHAPQTVELAAESGPAHYGLHLLLFSSAMLMWIPICSPLPEQQLSAPTKMIYLFLQSIIPTIPAGWLTVAEGTVYKHYDHEPRLWGIDAIPDQQAAGAIMKIIGGMYLWVIIAVIFFRWAAEQERMNTRSRTLARQSTLPDDLTYDEVVETFKSVRPSSIEGAPKGDPSLN